MITSRRRVLGPSCFSHHAFLVLVEVTRVAMGALRPYHSQWNGKQLSSNYHDYNSKTNYFSSSPQSVTSLPKLITHIVGGYETAKPDVGQGMVRVETRFAAVAPTAPLLTNL